MKELSLILAISCWVSFIWSIKAFFRRRSGPLAPKMKAIQVIGFLTMLLQGYGIVALIPKDHLLIALGCLTYLASLGLFWWSAATVRKASPGIAFSKVESSSLIVDGPYRWVRHPFYLSYILAWLAGLFASGVLLSIIPAFALLILYVQAAREEESRMLTSRFRNEYKRYMKNTGFLFFNIS